MKWGVRKDRRAGLKSSKQKYKKDVKTANTTASKAIESAKNKRTNSIQKAKEERLARDAKTEAKALEATKGNKKATTQMLGETNPAMRNFDKGMYTTMLAQCAGIPLAAAVSNGIRAGTMAAAMANPLVGGLALSAAAGAAVFGPKVYEAFSKKLAKKKELMLKELQRKK